MENFSHTLRCLTTVDILRITEQHVGSYQVLKENGKFWSNCEIFDN